MHADNNRFFWLHIYHSYSYIIMKRLCVIENLTSFNYKVIVDRLHLFAILSLLLGSWLRVVADLVSVFEATTSSSLHMIAVILVVPQSPTSFPSCYFRINIFTANPQLTGKLPLLGEKLGFGRMTTTFKNRLKAFPSHDALVSPSLTSSINFNFNFYHHFDNNKNKMITT